MAVFSFRRQAVVLFASQAGALTLRNAHTHSNVHALVKDNQYHTEKVSLNTIPVDQEKLSFAKEMEAAQQAYWDIVEKQRAEGKKTVVTDEMKNDPKVRESRKRYLALLGEQETDSDFFSETLETDEEALRIKAEEEEEALREALRKEEEALKRKAEEEQNKAMGEFFLELPAVLSAIEDSEPVVRQYFARLEEHQRTDFIGFVLSALQEPAVNKYFARLEQHQRFEIIRSVIRFVTKQKDLDEAALEVRGFLRGIALDLASTEEKMPNLSADQIAISFKAVFDSSSSLSLDLGDDDGSSKVAQEEVQSSFRHAFRTPANFLNRKWF